MNESNYNPSPERESDMNKERMTLFVEMVEKLSQFERLPFPGINPESYASLKAVDEKFPGYTTPIDELIKRFESEGMKVVLGNDKESGNVFILPAGSNDIEKDSVFPRHLNVSEDMGTGNKYTDAFLKTLIEGREK
jgi:hypothetical protein